MDAAEPGPARSDAAPRRVGAVVVNHDAGTALLDCVASLRAAGVSTVVVVDNASADGSLARLASVDAAAVLVPTGRNLGYGRAANRGAARLREELLLVCNPDLVVDPDAVGALADRLEREPDVALVGPRLENPDGSRYPSARAFPNLGVAAGHALLGLFVPDNRWSRRYRMEDRYEAVEPGRRDAVDRSVAVGAAPAEPDWVSGACFLVRSSAFASVGGFDEGYFMYAEDIDLCWRLRRAGWRIAYEPAARVVHAQGLSSSRRPVRMLLAHHRSTWRFARRSASGASRALLPLVGLALAARCAVAVARELARGRRPPG